MGRTNIEGYQDENYTLEQAEKNARYFAEKMNTTGNLLDKFRN